MNHIEEKRLFVNELIKNNDLDELEKCIKKKTIILKELNDKDYDILIFAIENGASITMIKFIIYNLKYKTLNYQFYDNGKYTQNNNTGFFKYSINSFIGIKTPLISAIYKQRFDIANLLIENKADINYKLNNNEKYNYITYLYEVSDTNLCFYLNHKTLNYILNKGFKKENINSELLIDLIISFKNDLLEIIFKHYIYDNDFVLYFLNLYKYKNTLTQQQIEKIIKNEKDKIIINKQCYDECLNVENYYAIVIFFTYESIELNKILSHFNKTDIMKKTIEKNDYCILNHILNHILIMEFEDFNSINFELILKEACRRNSLDTMELLLEKLLSNTSFDFNSINFEDIIIESCKKSNSNTIKLLIQTLNKKYFNFKTIHFEKVLIEVKNKFNEKDIIKCIMEPLLNIKNDENTNNNINKIDVSIIENFDTPFLILVLNMLIKVQYLEVIKYIIECNELQTKLDINATDINGDYLIITAYLTKNINIFEYLLKQGANCNVENKDGINFIDLLKQNKDFKFAKCLLQHLYINTDNINENYNPLINAIYHNRVKTVKLLVKHDYIKKFNSKNNYLSSSFPYFGLAPHFIAYLLNYYEIFQCLVENSDVNERDNYGNTILYYALVKEDVKTIKYLINLGADVNIKIGSKEYGKDHLSIFYSIIIGNKDIFLMLIENNDILYDVPNDQNQTPLIYLMNDHHFLLKDKLEMIEKLLIKGANVNFIDNYKNSPLIYAVQNRQLPIIKLLVKYGANVNYINKGKSLLMYAIELGEVKITKYLIDHHANVYFKDKFDYYDMIEAIDENRKTEMFEYLTRSNVNIFPSHIIKDIIHDERFYLLKILISNHVNINMKDSKGNTPLVYAIKKRSQQMVDYLIDCGADIHNVNKKGESIFDLCCKYYNTFSNSSIKIYNKIYELINKC